MTPECQNFPPNTRCMLNEIVLLLFAREAADSKGVSPERIGALAAQFGSASMADIATVKSLLSRLVDEFEKVESRIEIREMEELQLASEIRAKAYEERRRAMVPILEQGRRNEGAKMLRGWLVQDQELILKKIKSEELLTLPKFLEVAGVNKRAVSAAITAGRMFFILGPDGQNYYPDFFADSNEYIRKCIGKVCRALKGISAYGKYQFLTTNNVLIGGQPLDAIRGARVDDVLHATKYLLESDRSPASNLEAIVKGRV